MFFYFLPLNGTSKVEVAEGFTQALSPSFSLGISLAPDFLFFPVTSRNFFWSFSVESEYLQFMTGNLLSQHWLLPNERLKISMEWEIALGGIRLPKRRRRPSSHVPGRDRRRLMRVCRT